MPELSKEDKKLMLEALEEAIEIKQGQTNLARAIGKTQGHVAGWLYRDKKVAPEVVLPIERETGVSRHRLRPDIFGSVGSA